MTQFQTFAGILNIKWNTNSTNVFFLLLSLCSNNDCINFIGLLELIQASVCFINLNALDSVSTGLCQQSSPLCGFKNSLLLFSSVKGIKIRRNLASSSIHLEWINRGSIFCVCSSAFVAFADWNSFHRISWHYRQSGGGHEWRSPNLQVILFPPEAASLAQNVRKIFFPWEMKMNYD